MAKPGKGNPVTPTNTGEVKTSQSVLGGLVVRKAWNVRRQRYRNFRPIDSAETRRAIDEGAGTPLTGVALATGVSFIGLCPKVWTEVVPSAFRLIVTTLPLGVGCQQRRSAGSIIERKGERGANCPAGAAQRWARQGKIEADTGAKVKP
jgi:hypothetical protein